MVRYEIRGRGEGLNRGSRRREKEKEKKETRKKKKGMSKQTTVNQLTVFDSADQPVFCTKRDQTQSPNGQRKVNLDA